MPLAAGASRQHLGQRPFRASAAVHAGRSEEHDGVLNLVRLETTQRLQVLRENSNRPAVLTREELRQLKGKRLFAHGRHSTIRAGGTAAARVPRSAISL